LYSVESGSSCDQEIGRLGAGGGQGLLTSWFQRGVAVATVVCSWCELTTVCSRSSRRSDDRWGAWRCSGGVWSTRARAPECRWGGGGWGRGGGGLRSSPGLGYSSMARRVRLTGVHPDQPRGGHGLMHRYCMGAGRVGGVESVREAAVGVDLPNGGVGDVCDTRSGTSIWRVRGCRTATTGWRFGCWELPIRPTIDVLHRATV